MGGWRRRKERKKKEERYCERDGKREADGVKVETTEMEKVNRGRERERERESSHIG